MVNSVDSIYMFGKEADIMRMLRSEDQNRGFDENWPFCDVFLLPYIPFSSYSKLHRELSTSSQLSKPSEHVRQGGRYHAGVEIWGPESRIWWKTGRFVTFWPLPHIPFNSYSKLHQECTTPASSWSKADMFEKGANTMHMFRSEAERKTAENEASLDRHVWRVVGGAKRPDLFSSTCTV